VIDNAAGHVWHKCCEEKRHRQFLKFWKIKVFVGVSHILCYFVSIERFSQTWPSSIIRVFWLHPQILNQFLYGASQKWRWQSFGLGRWCSLEVILMLEWGTHCIYWIKLCCILFCWHAWTATQLPDLEVVQIELIITNWSLWALFCCVVFTYTATTAQRSL